MEAAQRVCLFVIFKQVGEKRSPGTYNMKQNVENVFTLFKEDNIHFLCIIKMFKGNVLFM